MSEQDTFKPVYHIVCDLAFIDPDRTLHCFFRMGAMDKRFVYSNLKIHGQKHVLHLHYVAGRTMHTVGQVQALGRAFVQWYKLYKQGKV